MDEPARTDWYSRLNQGITGRKTTKVGPNLLLPVRLICRLRALGFVYSFVGRQYLVSGGLVTVAHHACLFSGALTIVSGLDRNDIDTLLEKKPHGETLRRMHQPHFGRATRALVILTFHFNSLTSLSSLALLLHLHRTSFLIFPSLHHGSLLHCSSKPRRSGLAARLLFRMISGH